MSGRPRRPSGPDQPQDHDRLHPTSRTDRACHYVATGEAFDHGLSGFPGLHIGFGLSEQGSVTRQFDFAVTIGEQAIAANAHEAGWQAVQQKTPDEFDGVELHHFDSRAIAIVAPTEQRRPARLRGGPLEG